MEPRRSKIQVKGGRESINAFYVHRYYDGQSPAMQTRARPSMSTMPTVAYLQMYREIVTPVSTALLYGKLVEAEESMKYEKWGEYRGLQYASGSGLHLMRFIPWRNKSDYEAYFSNDGVTISHSRAEHLQTLRRRTGISGN